MAASGRRSPDAFAGTVSPSPETPPRSGPRPEIRRALFAANHRSRSEEASYGYASRSKSMTFSPGTPLSDEEAINSFYELRASVAPAYTPEQADNVALQSFSILHRSPHGHRPEEFKELLSFSRSPWSAAVLTEHLDQFPEEGRSEIKAELKAAFERLRVRQGLSLDTHDQIQLEQRGGLHILAIQNRVLSHKKPWDGYAQILKDARALEPRYLKTGLRGLALGALMKTVEDRRLPGETVDDSMRRFEQLQTAFDGTEEQQLRLFGRASAALERLGVEVVAESTAAVDQHADHALALDLLPLALERSQSLEDLQPQLESLTRAYGMVEDGDALKLLLERLDSLEDLEDRQEIKTRLEHRLRYHRLTTPDASKAVDQAWRDVMELPDPSTIEFEFGVDHLTIGDVELSLGD